MKIIQSIAAFGIGLALVCAFGCDSMEDNFKQYLQEYNYSGKVDSVRVYPGLERVILAWDNPIDQKSKSILIRYGVDSTELKYDTLVDSVSIDGLAAGTGYEFIIYTVDAYGNLSVPTSVTAFPVSKDFVSGLTAPSLVVNVVNNEQSISLIGLSNVLMKFSGKLDYTVTAPDGTVLSGKLDITDQLTEVDPVTGRKTIKTLPELSVPVSVLGVPFLPPGRYTFDYTEYVWPIIGGVTAVDEVGLHNKVVIDVQPIIINIMTLGGTIEASADNGPGESKEKLVDGKSNTKILAFQSAIWVKYTTKAPQIVTKYTLTSANDAPERDPKDWILSAWDGSNWVELDRRTDVNFTTRFETKTFEIANSMPYQVYRMEMRNHSGGLIQLAEWTLYGPKLL